MELALSLWGWFKGALSTEFFAAVAAGLSFLVAWRQHVWNKRNHLASVKPYIVDHLAEDINSTSIAYTLSNEGMGPAIIESFEVTWDAKLITMSDLKLRIYQEFGECYTVGVGEFNKHFALAQGRSFVLLTIKEKTAINISGAKGRIHLEQKTETLVKSCRVKVKYKSFLSSELQTFETPLVDSVTTKKGLFSAEN